MRREHGKSGSEEDVLNHPVLVISHVNYDVHVRFKMASSELSRATRASPVAERAR